MAPIRRYLRISNHSVLECRIYLADPGDERWLESRSSVRMASDQYSAVTVIERIIAAIRPLVLPKLREENARKASGKKKSAPVKDVLLEETLTVKADDFEVAIFLRETGTRHSLVTRQKMFAESGDVAGVSVPVGITNEEELVVHLEDIPSATDDRETESEELRPTRRHRKQRERSVSNEVTPREGSGGARPAKRVFATQCRGEDKKLAARVAYEGFSIWGWILCLLITRRKASKDPTVRAEQVPQGELEASTSFKDGQTLMEEWISTQAPQELVDED
ncbi:hypothetical protein KEM54_000345 [Ascosphaera aggregata]|nr:hypothetical protein KEM54_000345 [Ascosphaera aggregata]